jgi:hypothetical protein
VPLQHALCSLQSTGKTSTKQISGVFSFFWFDVSDCADDSGDSGLRPWMGKEFAMGLLGGRSNTGYRFHPKLELLESRLVPAAITVGANLNISKLAGNQNEAAIALDPANPNLLFSVSNNEATIPGLFGAFSTDGGQTWHGRQYATGTDGLPTACCDPEVQFDEFGNLWMIYLIDHGNGVEHDAALGLSTDGGQAFSLVHVFTDAADQPVVGIGDHTVWVEYQNDVPTVSASGAVVTGLGAVGTFSTPTILPGSLNGNFGDLAISPTGGVLVVYQNFTIASGPNDIMANFNPTGIGGSFNPATIVTSTNIGADQGAVPPGPPYPAQSNNFGIDAEANLAWDRSNGAHHGRVYMVYTDGPVDTPPAADIFVRFSDDNGTTWSAPIQVNSDAPNIHTHFLPSITIDETTGNVAIQWYDTRNDPNNVFAQLWSAISTDGGLTWTNVQVSAGSSNSNASEPPENNLRPLGYGDYEKSTAFVNGVFYPVWADNSNSTGDNPDGSLSRLDIYTAKVSVSVIPPPTTSQFIATGAGAGGLPEVKVFDAKTGALVLDFLAYNAAFRGGVRVAVGDVNGDGVDDIVTAPGFGGSPDIRVFDGKTGALMTEFMAFDPRFNGGAFVAVKDLNGDGRADIIVGAGAGGGPEVKAFSGANGSLLADFYAYSPLFNGGVTVAAGDLFGNGQKEIITGAGPGGGPHVREFSSTGASLGGGFYAYDPNFNGGVSVATGDVEANGQDQIVTGAGHGGGPNVRIFSGQNGALFAQFMAGPSATTLFFDDGAPFLSGVNVAVVARSGDGHADIITSFGPGGPSVVKTFDGDTLQQVDSFFAFSTTIPGGVFVGAA